MREHGWVRGLLALARRVALVTIVSCALFAAVGFALAGTDGVRNGLLFGLLAGGMSIPFALETAVALDGDGANEETRAAYFSQVFGLGTKD